jgi:hypothetical protein
MYSGVELVAYGVVLNCVESGICCMLEAVEADDSENAIKSQNASWSIGGNSNSLKGGNSGWKSGLARLVSFVLSRSPSNKHDEDDIDVVVWNEVSGVTALESAGLAAARFLSLVTAACLERLSESRSGVRRREVLLGGQVHYFVLAFSLLPGATDLASSPLSFSIDGRHKRHIFEPVQLCGAFRRYTGPSFSSALPEGHL